MAERIAPSAARVGNVLLLAGVLAVLMAVGPAIMSLVGNGTVLAP